MIADIPTKNLAQCLGTTIGFASQIKHGHRKIPPKHCLKVSLKFGVPLHELRPDIYPAPVDEPV
jgi:DNA-binding transcriptional regulator YdaS (Cro superfamily)